MGSRLAALWVVLIAGVLIAGCGAPQYTFVANTTDHAYFKVPNRWHKIADTALAAEINSGSPPPAAGGGGPWSVGYDASTIPSASHALSPATRQPFAFAQVGKLNSTTQNAMSYDGLRDFFLPVTAVARQIAASQGFPLTGFRLLHDALLTPGQGVHGVHVTFDYRYPDGSLDTFDQVAFTNADNTEVYVLLVHCLATCYSQHRSEINAVMSSFTVRSP